MAMVDENFQFGVVLLIFSLTFSYVLDEGGIENKHGIKQINI